MFNQNRSQATRYAINALVVGVSVVSALVFMLYAHTAYAGPVEDVKDASRLYQQGKLDSAMTKVNAALAVQPKDAQGRFIKGLILTEQKRAADAIQIFTGLTEDYPELPEPYNNLAVLYASQGNYDKAKAALELAIHTHPSYATAHENLGDIYAQLARRAYDKALQLDKNNATAQSKLAMVKDLFLPPKVVTASATAAVAVAAVVEPAKSASAAAQPAKQNPVVTIAAAATSTSKPVETLATPAPGGNTSTSAQIASTINAWANAWSAKDVGAYLGFYAPDFETPAGLSRSAWEVQRRERIDARSSIKVVIKMNKITFSGNEATAVFRQTYRADKIVSDNTKTIKLLKSGDRWLIRSERAGG